MAFKLKFRTLFPANVTASSPLTLVKTGLRYAFGLDIGALQNSLDPLYTPALFTQDGTGAIPYSYSEKVGQVLSAKDFGVTGDGTTDDYAKIVIARAAAIAAGKSLGFPDGVYCHSQKIEWASQNFHVLALGGNVVFKFTGTGRAHSCDGESYSAIQGVRKFIFGGAYEISLVGNANCTEALYVRRCHWSFFKVRARDAVTAFDLNSSIGATFELNCSADMDQTGFALNPDFGIKGTEIGACIFTSSWIENCGNNGNYAIKLVNSSGNWFHGGGTESNLGGGVYIASDCHRNSFMGFDVEANDLSSFGLFDWAIFGNENILTACSGAGALSGNYFDGFNNKFDTCDFWNGHVQASASDLWFENCKLQFTFTDLGTRTTNINPTGSAGATPKSWLGDITGTTIVTSGSGNIQGALNTNTGIRISGAAPANSILLGNGSVFLDYALGTGVKVALGINIGSAGAPVLFNGAGGTPLSMTATNLTGTASGLTAGTATNAVNSGIANDTTTNASMNLVWVTSNTGNLPLKVTSTKLTFNPSTGVLSATSFSGAGTGLTGTASSLTAGTASAVAVGGITGLGTGVATALGATLSASGGVAGITTGTWTPIDSSGAGLSFSGVNAAYTKIGSIVHAYGTLTFPATGSGATALIGGLPFTVANATYAAVPSIVRSDVGITGLMTVPVQNTTTFNFWINSANETNTLLQNGTFRFNLTYSTV